MHHARSILALSALLFACKEDKDPTVTGTSLSDPSGDPSGPSSTPTSGGPDSDSAEATGSAPASPRAVDFLFVVDNSGSMGDAQQRLVAGFPALAAVLDDPSDPFDYRIAFTTTDSGNPRCPSTSPENGNLVLSSCVNRVDDGQFVSADTDYSAVCTTGCSLTDDQLTIKPTTTDVDPNQVRRKWIERIGGASNLDVSTVDAFACYAPMGVAGCGFESHLESMYKAIAASKTSKSMNNYGFMREEASLVVVVISDETDCSYNPDYSEIFTANKVFWYDPATDVAPTSSMCWKAGVACEGSSPYSTCSSQNYDTSGGAGVSDDAAVLFPVDKYKQFFAEVEASKQQYDHAAQVTVALITGVPPGYETRDAELVYADSPDLAPGGFQSLFGIGPGCIEGPSNSPDKTAVPPVREREFAEAFNDTPDGDRLLYSICAPDYSAAFAHLGARLRG